MNRLYSAVLMSVFLTGCPDSSSQFFSEIPKPAVSVPPALNALPAPSPTPPSNSAVCDPFSSAGGKLQVAGTFLYLPSKHLSLGAENYGRIIDGTVVGNVKQQMDKSLNFPVSFYFSQINVPSQDFSIGFNITHSDATTSKVTYPGTNYQIQSYFGIVFQSDLILPRGSGTQAYQFALESDDGANLYLSQNGDPGPLSVPSTLVVNNDGQHPMGFNCSSAPYSLSDTKPTHLRVDWYQGPPIRLGVILRYRPWVDTRCDLRDLGWKIVPQELFQLPENLRAPGVCK